MNEQCADCPWYDDARDACYRKPPRFCDVDTTDNTSLTQAPTTAVRISQP